MKNCKLKILCLPLLLTSLVSCGGNTDESSSSTSQGLADLQAELEKLSIVNGVISLPKVINSLPITYTLSTDVKYREGDKDETNKLFWFNIPTSVEGIKYVDIKATIGSNNFSIKKEIAPQNVVTAKSVYSMEEDADVVFTGIVYAKQKDSARGYYVYDFSANLFAFGPASAVEIGDLVTITGKKATYFTLVQLKHEDATSVTKLGSGFAGVTPVAASISEINAKDPSLYKNVGMRYKFQARIVRRVEAYETKCYLVDPITKKELQVYYLSDQETVLTEENKYVNITATVYSYNQDLEKWVVTFTKGLDTIEVISKPVFSDEEGLEAVDINLKEELSNKVVLSSIDLPTAYADFNATITYASNNPTIINDAGEVIANPAVDTIVSMTATIKCGTKTKTATYSFTVLMKKELTLAKLYQEAQALRDSEAYFVSSSGVVVGKRNAGLFVSDETTGIYINLSGYTLASTVKEGDIIKFTGSIALVKGCPQVKEIIDLQIISSSNPLPAAAPLDFAQFESNYLVFPNYAREIEVTGKLIVTRGQYGNAYKLMKDGKTLNIHANSNTYALNYAADKDVSIKCFILEGASDSYKAYFFNQDGDCSYQGNEDENIATLGAYIDDILPASGAKISADVKLPKTHVIDESLTVSYSSSAPEILSPEGKFTPTGREETVTITASLKAGTKTVEKSYTYVTAAKTGTFYTDLVFSGLMRGISVDKMFSIYNNTGKDIDLSKYKVCAFQNSGNGSASVAGNCTSASATRALAGTLRQGETLVIYNEGMSIYVKNQMPLADNPLFLGDPNTGGVTQFNAKDGDVMSLVREGVIIDQIGSDNKLPYAGMSNEWEEEFIANKTIIRKINVGPSGNIVDWSELTKVREIFTIEEAAMETNNYHINSMFYNYRN